MSKISLQPNASGAGTFSIVSPDSNINRTLTLPDESGSVLSDSSTIDSNNLQSDVYKQDNILGTVSESGGVPTGAIIEQGSNANGRFILFADGTQICVSFPAFGASNTAHIFTFPKNFNENNPNTGIIINATFSTGSAGEFARVSVSRGSGSGGEVTNNTYPVFRDGTGNQRGTYIIAIGRWY